MNPRHAIALVLVGWYLMIAPNRPSRVWGEARPLSDWEIVQSFDSAADCRQLRQQFQQLAITLREDNPAHDGKPSVRGDEDTVSAMQNLYDRLSPNVDVIDDLTDQLLLMKYFIPWEQHYDPKKQALSMRLMSVQCIATDDPRLKGK
jgi:hypothetical protein